jgi:hypothetical protein
MEKTLLEKLWYLNERNVKVIWTKREPPIYAFATGLHVHNSITPPPTMPQQITLFTNESIKDTEDSVGITIALIEAYDDYMEELKDVPEVLTLKEEFEKLELKALESTDFKTA